ncbi:hypothetical protein LguiA_021222 [Lonicera macranthoides]
MSTQSKNLCIQSPNFHCINRLLFTIQHVQIRYFLCNLRVHIVLNCTQLSKLSKREKVMGILNPHPTRMPQRRTPNPSYCPYCRGYVQECQSHEACKDLIKAPEMAVTMQEFSKEMTKAGMIEEIVNDAVVTVLDSEILKMRLMKKLTRS